MIKNDAPTIYSLHLAFIQSDAKLIEPFVKIKEDISKVMNINNVRFADDTVLLGSLEGLQTLIDKLVNGNATMA